MIYCIQGWKEQRLIRWLRPSAPRPRDPKLRQLKMSFQRGNLLQSNGERFNFFLFSPFRFTELNNSNKCSRKPEATPVLRSCSAESFDKENALWLHFKLRRKLIKTWFCGWNRSLSWCITFVCEVLSFMASFTASGLHREPADASRFSLKTLAELCHPVNHLD